MCIKTRIAAAELAASTFVSGIAANEVTTFWRNRNGGSGAVILRFRIPDTNGQQISLIYFNTSFARMTFQNHGKIMNKTKRKLKRKAEGLLNCVLEAEAVVYDSRFEIGGWVSY